MYTALPCVICPALIFPCFKRVCRQHLSSVCTVAQRYQRAERSNLRRYLRRYLRRLPTAYVASSGPTAYASTDHPGLRCAVLLLKRRLLVSIVSCRALGQEVRHPEQAPAAVLSPQQCNTSASPYIGETGVHGTIHTQFFIINGDVCAIIFSSAWF
jgi:hypothetical protein